MNDTTKASQPDQTAQESRKEQQRVKALKKKYRQQLREDYQAKANELTTFYILAQRRYYNGNYETALAIVNKALRLQETADLLALKGSIYLGLNDIDKFEKHWRRALTMDKDVPLPLTDGVVEQLKDRGLLNENLERNF